MFRLFSSLWKNRELIIELSRRELFQGHASHFLGGAWVLANPLITLAIYFWLFHYVFPTRVGGAAGAGSAEVFLLAGLVQWIVQSELMVRACNIARQNANLVKQINFPLQALVAKTVASSLFIQIVMSAGLAVVMLFQPGGITLIGIALWLLAMVLQTLFMLGSALALAAVTPFLPDVTEFVGNFARLGLFVTPILYASDRFGSVVSGLFFFNPFSYFAWIHQDALYAQAFTSAVAWIGATALSISSLWFGERLFRQMSPAFNDVL
jgi:lipopolysaccharide transport system permease protein